MKAAPFPGAQTVSPGGGRAAGEECLATLTHRPALSSVLLLRIGNQQASAAAHIELSPSPHLMSQEPRQNLDASAQRGPARLQNSYQSQFLKQVAQGLAGEEHVEGVGALKALAVHGLADQAHRELLAG